MACGGSKLVDARFGISLHDLVSPFAELDRFQNSSALAGIVQGGIFLRKMPLKVIVFEARLF